MDGVDGTLTLPTQTTNATTEVHCLGTHLATNTAYPLHTIIPYLQIWNRYFKHPGDTDQVETFFNVNTDNRNFYGLPCCYPKRVWNTGRFLDDAGTSQTATHDRDWETTW